MIWDYIIEKLEEGPLEFLFMAAFCVIFAIMCPAFLICLGLVAGGGIISLFKD